jgi:hypothetical protein
MRARLRLNHDGVTVLLAASVDEHLPAGGTVYRWPTPLWEYDRHPAVLIFDDGRRLNVIVDGPLLRQTEADDTL